MFSLFSERLPEGRLYGVSINYDKFYEVIVVQENYNVRERSLPVRDSAGKYCKVEFDKNNVMTKARTTCDAFLFVLRMKKTDGDRVMKNSC